MSEATQKGWLMFSWPDDRRVSFALPGFIALSGLAHALVFYGFQVVYPVNVSSHPPPVQVSVLTPDLGGAATLFRWIEAEDPAAIAAPREIPLPAGLDLPFKPSFAETTARPLSPPPTPARVSFPPAKSALELVQAALFPLRQPPKEVPAAKTTLRVSGTLADREVTGPEISPQEKADGNLQPTTFLAGVNERGELQYAFLQNSSGNAAIDREAEAHLARVKIEPAGDRRFAWGFVTFLWGADAFNGPEANRPAPDAP